MANPTTTPAAQLAGFIAKFSPPIARDARAALLRLRRLLPAGAVRMVYDNWNGLVVGFGPNDRASEAIVSLLITADHLSLCFINDAPGLPDPAKLLKGSGTVVRHIRLAGAADLDRAPIKALVAAAVARSDAPFDRRGPSALIIKSISPRQRPRRKTVLTATSGRGSRTRR
jgi:hypothetical protein